MGNPYKLPICLLAHLRLLGATPRHLYPRGMHLDIGIPDNKFRHQCHLLNTWNPRTRMIDSKVRTTRILTHTFARTLAGPTHQLLCKHSLQDILTHSRLRQRLRLPLTVIIRLGIILPNAIDVGIARVLMRLLSPAYNRPRSRYRPRTPPRRTLVRPPAPGGPTKFTTINEWDLAQTSATMEGPIVSTTGSATESATKTGTEKGDRGRASGSASATAAMSSSAAALHRPTRTRARATQSTNATATCRMPAASLEATTTTTMCHTQPPRARCLLDRARSRRLAAAPVTYITIERARGLGRRHTGPVSRWTCLGVHRPRTLRVISKEI